MTAPREVLIDGIRYVPAIEATAGTADLLRVLALQYHTPESLAEDGTSDLRVIVSDTAEPDEGETFDQLAARLAEELR